MDANSGEPWPEMDISDLTNELDHGRTIAETASFLCRDVYEVRAKILQQTAINRFLNDHNADCKPFQWVAHPDKMGTKYCITRDKFHGRPLWTCGRG